MFSFEFYGICIGITSETFCIAIAVLIQMNA